MYLLWKFFTFRKKNMFFWKKVMEKLSKEIKILQGVLWQIFGKKQQLKDLYFV